MGTWCCQKWLSKFRSSKVPSISSSTVLMFSQLIIMLFQSAFCS